MATESPRPLPHSFFARDAAAVASDLIGKIIVRRTRGRVLRARIVETEAYLGPADLASHASKGRTGRTEVMFGPAGHAYVYLIYGMHWMLNIVAGCPGDAHAVLLRAAESLDGWECDLSGPGKLARGLKVTRRENTIDVTGARICFLDNPADRAHIVKTKRINIDYAGPWKEELLRFLDANSNAVSGKRQKRPSSAESQRPSGERAGNRLDMAGS